MKISSIAGAVAGLGLSAFALSAGVALADPVDNAAHQVAKAGRATGHVVAATGRHVEHDVNGTSDRYNDHPGHAGYRRHHRHRHFYYDSHHHRHYYYR